MTLYVLISVWRNDEKYLVTADSFESIRIPVIDVDSSSTFNSLASFSHRNEIGNQFHWHSDTNRFGIQHEFQNHDFAQPGLQLINIFFPGDSE